MDCSIRRTDFFAKEKSTSTELKTVLQLRSHYSGAKHALTDPTKYYDPTCYETAMRG